MALNLVDEWIKTWAPDLNGGDIIRAILEMPTPPAKILPMCVDPKLRWVHELHLTELAETEKYKRWVCDESYVISDETDFMDLIRKAFAGTTFLGIQ